MWFPSCRREIWFSTAGRLKLWEISRACRREQFFHYDRESNCVSYRISEPALGFCHQRGMPARVMMLCLLLTFTVRAGAPPGAWTGPYSPCDGHAEILKQGRMNLGVRFSTSNPALKTEFAHAMSFWASVLDMNWHEEDSRACAIQAVDGVPDLFVSGAVARAQFPGLPAFQGWIAFNPRRSLPANEMFVTAVHELGHVLGLPHSANASSAMYFLALDGPLFLDSADLAALATRHRLRAVAGKVGVPQLSLQDWRRMSRVKVR